MKEEDEKTETTNSIGMFWSRAFKHFRVCVPLSWQEFYLSYHAIAFLSAVVNLFDVLELVFVCLTTQKMLIVEKNTVLLREKCLPHQISVKIAQILTILNIVLLYHSTNWVKYLNRGLSKWWRFTTGKETFKILQFRI